MSLNDIAGRTDVPRATTHRLAGELAEWGALERLLSKCACSGGTTMTRLNPLVRGW